MSKRFEQQNFVTIYELVVYCAFITGFIPVCFEINWTKIGVLFVLKWIFGMVFYLNQKNVSLSRQLRINELLKD
jgi:hypothetical protein